MGRRERLWKRFSGKPATSVSPQPVPYRPALPAVPNAQASTGPSNTTNVSTATGASENEASRNCVLKLAIEKHLDALPEAEKEVFRESSKKMTEDYLILRIKTCNARHEGHSRFRPQAETLSKFLGLLNRFMAGIAIGIQANPDISSIIVGAVRVVIDLAINFVTFFIRLSEMISRFGDFLGPMTEYAKASEQKTLVRETFANVYGDLLRLCTQARSVFIHERGAERKWTSWRVFWRIQWVPFEEEFGKIESDLQHHLDVLRHSTQAIGINASLEASRAEKERRMRETVAERESFLNWISSTSFEKTHEDTHAKKHPGTGEWLVQTPQFQAWLDGTASSLLWCYGKPGIGKSVLASNVLEYITTERALRKEVGISFAYYNYQLAESQELSQIVSALIKQLCQKKSTIPARLIKAKQDAVDPRAVSNQDSFITLAQDFEEVLLVIDALDECPKDERPKVLGFILGIMNSLSHAKIFITSRREQDILEAFEQLSTPAIQIEAKNVAADISKYVKSETERLREGYNGKKLYVKDDALGLKILKTLTEKSEGMFLWVNLQLATLCQVSQSRKDRDLENALEKLPQGLDANYIRILDQIDSQQDNMKTLAWKCFKWVMYAQRPLTTRELQHALATTNLYKSTEDLELDDVDVILRACANLLVEESLGSWQNKIVRPIHYSVQEFFTNPGVGTVLKLGLEKIGNSCYVHAELARTCLLYLQSKSLEQGPCFDQFRLYDRMTDLCFGWYAARLFDYHVLRSGCLPKNLLQLINEFLEKRSPFLASILQLKTVSHRSGLPQTPDPWADFDDYRSLIDKRTFVYATGLYDVPELQSLREGLQPPPFALHRACSVGLINVVTRLCTDSVDVNEHDQQDISPIYYAARRGDLPIVKVLIDNIADVNTQGGHYGNALQAASAGGHETVVQLLLEKGADIHAQGGEYGNALLAASAEGHETVVQLLLEKCADIHVQGGHYRNALLAASVEGHETVVQLLLEKGADVHAPGGVYGNALQAALAGGHETVVQLLLEKGADIHAQGGHYGNALQAASAGGHETVVQLLLRNGADISTQDKDAADAAVEDSLKLN